jgi:hypothetical protein
MDETRILSVAKKKKKNLESKKLILVGLSHNIKFRGDFKSLE